MRKRYTRKQISEAITFWERQLETIDTINEFVPLLESRDQKEQEAIKQASEEVREEIQKPEDVEKFIKKNDQKVKSSGSTFLKGLWLGLKAIVRFGGKFILKNWKLVIAVALIVILWTYGVNLVSLMRRYRDWYMTTPAFEMHHAEGNGGLNAYFDPGGWY